MSKIGNYKVTLFGASVDPVEANKEFRQKNNYNFVLLSDPTKEYARKLGVLGPSGFSNRWTYVIDEQGIIRHIDKSVNVGAHGADLCTRLEELKIPKKPQ